MTQAPIQLAKINPVDVEEVTGGLVGLFAGTDGNYYVKEGSSAPRQIAGTDETTLQGIVDDSLADYLNVTDTNIAGVLIGVGGEVRAATYDEVMPVVQQAWFGSRPTTPTGRYVVKTDYFNLGTNDLTPYVNIVQTWGYNYDYANPNDIRIGFTIESNYALNNVGPYIAEAHLQMNTLEGDHYRLMHCNLPRSSADKIYSSIEWRAQTITFSDYDGIGLFRFNFEDGTMLCLVPAEFRDTTVKADNVSVPVLRETNKTFEPADHLIATSPSGTRLFVLPHDPFVGQKATVTSAGATVQVYPHPDYPDVVIRSGANATTTGGNYSSYIGMASYSTLEFTAVSSTLWVVSGGTPGVTHTWV